MKSLTKAEVSREELSAICREVWGAELQSFSELTDGWFNTAYSLETVSGDCGILKVAPGGEVDILRYEERAMQIEVSVLRRLREETAVPVPEVYLHDSGCTLLDREFFVMERLGGEPYNRLRERMSPAQRAAVEFELGGHNRQINEITGTGFGMYSRGEELHGDWYSCFRGLVEDLLADRERKGAELKVSDEEILALVAKHREALAGVSSPSLVHWDLWDGNVFVDGGRISGIIDFERCLWADRLMEVYFCSGHNPEFIRGYGLDPAQYQSSGGARMALYALYTAIIMVVESYYRGFSTEHLAWAEDNFSTRYAAAVNISG